MLKTHTKKITAFMSVAAMLFSMLLYFPDGTFSTCFGLKASAAEIELTEPSKFGGAYQIGTAGELYWFAEFACRENAVLTADITVNQNVLNENGELNSGDFTSWMPIGNSIEKYTGIFDGQGHTISGLYFNDSDRTYAGLFSNNSGTIKNVGVVDSYFNGRDSVGGVCGKNEEGVIVNCYNTGKADGSYQVGGVCGENFQGIIENCHNTGTVSAMGIRVSGVCGFNDRGTITNCYNAGNVSGDSEFGGVCGFNGAGTITNCYNTGTVSTTGNPIDNKIGGVCGVNTEGAIITNCYNTGNVSGDSEVGGLCGHNSDGTITNCYNTGEVSGDCSVGGVCGFNRYTITTNCYYDSTVNSVNAIGYNEGTVTVTDVEGKSTAQFASGEVAYLLSQGENGSVWGQDLSITDSYPVLDSTKIVYRNITYANCNGNPGEPIYLYSNTAAEPVYGKHSYDENGFCKDCGVYQPAADSDEDGVYEIGNTGQLYWFAEYVNGGNTGISAVLTDDIRINQNVLNENGELNSGDFRSWTPVSSYKGTFNGQGYTVSGLYFNDPDVEYAGLFGSVESGGKVSGVGIADSYFRGNDYIGGICGENVGTITNCYNSGTVISVNRKSVAGGICGYNEGTITNCYNSGNISAEGKASFIGGVCGWNENGTITNCYYLAETADENGGKTTAQFGSGEVAYLLSQGTDGSVWGQTIGTDPMPVMGGKKVLGNIDKSAFANDIIIYGQNAALDGTIGFNIYVSADDSYEWDKTIGGVTGVKNEEGLYVFTYNVAAKDMDENINFTISDKIDVTVSVSEYLAELSENDNAELKDLADSMSAYGDAAEAYFGNGIVAEQTVIDDLSIYDFIVGTMPEGIRYYGSSLILESETTIRHYFTLAEGKNIADFTFKVNNSAVTPTEKQGYYCIDIQNISAEKLETAFTVSINGKKIITNYSALSYAKKVLDSDKIDDNLKNLVKALYIYSQNALAYINAA